MFTYEYIILERDNKETKQHSSHHLTLTVNSIPGVTDPLPVDKSTLSIGNHNLFLSIGNIYL